MKVFTYILLGVFIVLIIQYMRFKKCLDAVYQNCPDSYPNCISNCGELITNSNGQFGVRVRKFPFSATVRVGGLKNTI